MLQHKSVVDLRLTVTSLLSNITVGLQTVHSPSLHLPLGPDYTWQYSYTVTRHFQLNLRPFVYCIVLTPVNSCYTRYISAPQIFRCEAPQQVLVLDLLTDRQAPQSSTGIG